MRALRRDFAALRLRRVDAGRPDLQLFDHQPARQSKRDRPCADHVWHGRGKLFRRIHSQRKLPPRRAWSIKTFQHQAARASAVWAFVGQTIFNYGFMVYAAIILAVILHRILNHTRIGPESARSWRKPRDCGCRRYQRHKVQISGHLPWCGHFRPRRPLLCAGLQSGHLGNHHAD